MVRCVPDGLLLSCSRDVRQRQMYANRPFDVPKSFPFKTHNGKNTKEYRTPRCIIFGLNHSNLAQKPSQITYLSTCLGRDSVLIDSEVEPSIKELVRCSHMACGRCAVRLFHLRPSTV